MKLFTGQKILIFFSAISWLAIAAPELQQGIQHQGGKSEESFEKLSNKNAAILNYKNFQDVHLPIKSTTMFEELIKMADLILKVETLVLFANTSSESRNFQYFAALKHDKVIITQDPKWQLRHFFHSNILSIVFIDSLQSQQEILEIFKRSLHRWHLKKVVFITDSFLLGTGAGGGKQLFSWLHDQGFWNSFLIDSQGNTLTMEHFSLKLLSNTLSVEDFFLLSIEWQDLQGHPVHVTMANDPPRALMLTDKYNSNKTIFTGYYGYVINIFADYYNATLVTHVLSDLDYYHELDCLKYIEENKADVCCDGMALRPDSYYVITNPEELVASYLMVPQDKPLPRFYYFLKPFQTGLWWLILFTIFYIIMALTLIHRLQNGSWLLAYYLPYPLVSFIHVPFELKRIRGRLRSYLELLLIFKGFVFSNWYLTLLTSLLYTRLYSKDINTIEDLQRLNISIIVNAYEYSMLNGTDLDPIIARQLRLVSDDMLFKHRSKLDPQYAYYSQYDKNEFYLYQQRFLLHPRMKELRDFTVHYIMGGMSLRFNWPFEHLLNNIYGCILDTGLFRSILDKGQEDGIRSGYLQFFPTEYKYVEPLNIEYFYLLCCVLVGGYLMAAISFLLEILYFKKFKGKQQHKISKSCKCGI